LEENVGGSKLPVDFIANQLYMSPSTLQRRVKKLTGKPTVQLIKEYKLKKAKEMIKANYGTLSEIAFKSGFNSLAYFSTSYKEFFGENPKEHLPK
jgi:AraC-like DNA-binding protein